MINPLFFQRGPSVSISTPRTPRLQRLTTHSNSMPTRWNWSALVVQQANWKEHQGLLNGHQTLIHQILCITRSESPNIHTLMIHCGW